MDTLIQIIRADAPLIALVGVGFWRVLLALYHIDRRLITVETKIALPLNQRGGDKAP